MALGHLSGRQPACSAHPWRMTDDGQQARRARLSDSSERLLEAIDDLHTLEQGKRAMMVSTPPFHALGEEIQRKSRAVFDMASDDVAQADRVETTTVSLDEIGGLHIDGRDRP